MHSATTAQDDRSKATKGEATKLEEAANENVVRYWLQAHKHPNPMAARTSIAAAFCRIPFTFTVAALPCPTRIVTLAPGRRFPDLLRQPSTARFSPG